MDASIGLCNVRFGIALQKHKSCNKGIRMSLLKQSLPGALVLALCALSFLAGRFVQQSSQLPDPTPDQVNFMLCVVLEHPPAAAVICVPTYSCPLLLPCSPSRPLWHGRL